MWHGDVPRRAHRPRARVGEDLLGVVGGVPEQLELLHAREVRAQRPRVLPLLEESVAHLLERRGPLVLVLARGVGRRLEAAA